MRIAEEVYGTISRLSVNELEGNEDVSGLVRVRMVSGIDFPAYDAFLAQFHRRYRGIEFESQEMSSSEVVNCLQQKTATLGLTPRRSLPKSINSRIFLPQRYALFCGPHHPLFGRVDLDIGEFSTERIVTFSSDKVGDHMSALTFFRDERGLTGRVIGSSSSVWEVKRLIAAGLGIGFLPEHVVQAELAEGRLQRLPPQEGVADIDICMLWATDQKRSLAEKVFLDAFHAFLDSQGRKEPKHLLIDDLAIG
nr:substrate-binding domain-containing protein [Paraburkholderia steynii]